MSSTFQNTGRGWWNAGDIGATLRTPVSGDATKANLVVDNYYRNAGGGEAIVMEHLISSYDGSDIAQTLDASYYKGAGSRNGKEREIVAVSDDGKGGDAMASVVRRLTPLE